MSGIQFVDTVTHVPAVWANAVNTLVYDIFGAPQSLAQAQARFGLQSLAFQAHTNINVTGGNINGVELGTGTPVSRLVAQAASVLNDPVNDTDIVNKGWLREWVRLALVSSKEEWLNGFGTMALQNANNVRIIAGTINSTDIGLTGRASGAFTTLKAANPPIDGDDVVTLGWLTAHYDVRLNALRSMAYQDANNVAIVGGEIDSVRIGLTQPVIARLQHGTVITVPPNYESIVNKRYVDSSIAAAMATLKSMAYQDSFAVSITGGTIDGTEIGGTAPSKGAFNDLSVVKNAAWLYLRTTSTATGNMAGIQWRDGQNEMARFVYLGADNVPANNLLDLSAVVPIQIRSTLGAGLRVAGVNTTLYGPNVNVAPGVGEKLIVGGGITKPGYDATFNKAAWFQALAAKRGFFQDGISLGYNYTHAVAAQGAISLPADNSAAFINLVGDATLTITPGDGSWQGLRERIIIVRNEPGGKKLNFGSNVFWGTQTPPDYTGMSVQDFDIVRLLSFNDGVSWFAESAYASGGGTDKPVIIFMAAQ